MKVCVALGPDGQVGGGWGRADRVAVSDIRGGEITKWDEYDVGWGRLHDEGPEGQHHARIAKFLQEHGVELVVTGHMGPGMVQMLARMRIAVRVGAGGNAREAAVAAVATVS